MATERALREWRFASFAVRVTAASLPSPQSLSARAQPVGQDGEHQLAQGRVGAAR